MRLSAVSMAISFLCLICGMIGPMAFYGPASLYLVVGTILYIKDRDTDYERQLEEEVIDATIKEGRNPPPLWLRRLTIPLLFILIAPLVEFLDP